MSKKDYYELLEVERSASADDIKKAFRRLAVKYHPDKNKGNKEAEDMFKKINQAYEVLKDEQKRAAYDRFGHDAYTQSGGGGSSGFGRGGFSSGGGFSEDQFSDIFSDLFGDFMGQRRRPQSQAVRGSDLRHNITITLEEAFKGLEQDISFRALVKCRTCSGSGSKDNSGYSDCSVCSGHGVVRMKQGFFTLEQTCAACSGRGKVIKNPCNTCNGNGITHGERKLNVAIPAGVESGTRIRIAGEGEAGQRGGHNGDLYIFVTVKTHEIFKVDGSDIHMVANISFAKAALGGEIIVPTIDGSEISVVVPSGSQNSDKLKVKSRGMSKVKSTLRGDFYIHLLVEVPKKLTSKQKELLEELDKELGDVKTTSSKDSSFFDKMKNLWGM